MNSDVLVHLSRNFAGLKTGQPSLFWEQGVALFEEATAFLNDEYCQSGARSSPRTWKNVAYALAFWFNWCSEAGIDWRAASRDDLVDFRDGLSTTVSAVTGDSYGAGTIIAYMAATIAFYDYARRRGVYFGDIVSSDAISQPANGVKSTVESASLLVPRRRSKKTTIRPFQPEELRACLAELGNTCAERDARDRRPCRDRLMADWGWAVGLRLSEIMTLEAYQFLTMHPEDQSDFSHQPVEVVGKGNVRRNVAVPNWLIADTLMYLEGERRDSIRASKGRQRSVPNVVFLSGTHAPSPGKPFSGRRYEQIIGDACIRAGLSQLKARTDPETGEKTHTPVAKHSVHDLRHTYAVYTYWVEVKNGNPEPWKTIQAQLGHESLDTTIRTYLRFVKLFGPSGKHDIRSLAGLGPEHG